MSGQIAFLGLGTMGGPMASNLARSGFDVRGWNRTPDRPSALEAEVAGVQVVSKLADAIAGAKVIALCVGDLADVEEVLFGAAGVAGGEGLAGAAGTARVAGVASVASVASVAGGTASVAGLAAPGTLVIDFSTIGPAAARDFAARLAAAGMRFLDAPVTGGDVGARAATLTVMVGGNAGDFASAAPVFAAVGKVAKHCGDCGAGQAVKLCNQVLAALHMVALTEALALARMQGIDPALVVEVCSTGAAGSWALTNLGPKVLARDFAPGFMVKHLVKDLRLVLETPPGHGLEELRGTILAKSLLEKVASLGGAEQGTQSLTLAYE
ncbi:MAG: NAD(P)-dependent oxidoreductase [Candidatus Binatia bacterium]